MIEQAVESFPTLSEDDAIALVTLDALGQRRCAHQRADLVYGGKFRLRVQSMSDGDKLDIAREHGDRVHATVFYRLEPGGIAEVPVVVSFLGAVSRRVLRAKGLRKDSVGAEVYRVPADVLGPMSHVIGYLGERYGQAITHAESDRVL